MFFAFMVGCSFWGGQGGYIFFFLLVTTVSWFDYSDDVGDLCFASNSSFPSAMSIFCESGSLFLGGGGGGGSFVVVFCQSILHCIKTTGTPHS